VTSPTHAELVAIAERWLSNQGCKIVLREFSTQIQSGEIPDAIGFGRGTSVLVECKTTRSDFLRDKRKPFRRAPEHGLGDWRYYLCPADVIQPSDLPQGWGLLWLQGNRVRAIVDPGKKPGVPRYGGIAPFEGHKRNEQTLLVSALRRLALRGHLPEIYEPLSGH